MKKLLITLMLALGLAACGGTTEDVTQAGDLVIREAWVRPAFVEGGNGAGYMLIENTGSTDDALVSASAAFAEMVEIHETTAVDMEDMEGDMDHGMDDVMGMRQVEEIAIPARETVALEVGGFHVMLMGIPERLEPGETVTLTLTFAEAGEVVVEAEVREE